MLTFHLIPHVHWDREWYRSRTAFLTKLVPMMDGLLDLLESDPSVRFHLDGQMIVVEDYLSVVPAARGTIEALVRRGQLGVGPWYVLADELIPGGVSLRRNLETGIRMARELGGECSVLYSPDAFGHPAALPSLAAEFGIASAVVWRGLGRVGGVERDLYRWRGPDGKAVTTYHLPPAGYEVGAALLSAADGLDEQWRSLRHDLTVRAVTDQVAVFVGADHHAPDPSLPLLAKRIAALEPEADVRFSSLDEYFAAVARTDHRLTELTGELRQSAGYAWSLQGVHSSRARQKRRYGQVERLLHRAAGPLDRAAGGSGAPLLDLAWRQLIQCQFHDTLAGCCADVVAMEQEVRLESVATLAGEAVREAVYRLVGHDPDRARRRPEATAPLLAVWNPNRSTQGGVVIAETTWFDADVLVGPPAEREVAEGLGYRAFHLTTEAGRRVPVQILRVAPGVERVDAPRHYPDLDRVDRVWVAAWLDPIEPRALAQLTTADGALPVSDRPAAVVATQAGLANGLASVSIGSDGLPEIVDGRSDRRYSAMLSVESEEDRGDLYTPDIIPGTLRTARITGVRRLAEGPLVGAIGWQWVLRPAGGGVVAGRTVLSLRAGEPGVRALVEFDHDARNHRLRLRLPLGLEEVEAGSPLGAVRRGPGRMDCSWPQEAVLPTAPASEFVASTAPAEPVRIATTGFFEYQLDPDGVVLLTLLRAVGQLSVQNGSGRNGHAAWPMPTPAAQEPGRHSLEFQLRFESGAGPLDLLPIFIRNAADRT